MNLSLPGRASDDRPFGRQEDVDLASNAELARKVNARLDREDRIGDEWPMVLRLQIVDVRAVTVR